jgi:hypothetical protein
LYKEMIEIHTYSIKTRRILLVDLLARDG